MSTLVDRRGNPLNTPTPATRSVGATISPAYAGKPQWLTRTPESLRREGMEKIALIFRCIQYTANAAGQSGVTLRVFDEKPDGTKDPINDHPLRLLMRQPNPQMREGRFLSYVTMIATAAGFCVVEKVRSTAGRVVALEPLNTEWLRPILRDQAPCDWEYRIPGLSRAFLLPSTEVLVFTYADRPNARLHPTGYGPVEACFREVGLLNVLTDFLKIFFDRGAMPVYGALVDQIPGASPLSQEEKDQIAEAFIARHGGLDKAAIPILLEGIKDIKRLSFDFDELALTDIRDMSDIAICQAFGIDPSTVGTRVGMEHSDSRANAKEANQKYYRDTMIPLWNRLDETLTLNLLPEFESLPTTRELAFDYSEVFALQEDRNQRAEWVGGAFTQGGISQHTWFEQMGLKPPTTPDFYLRGLAQQAIPADDPLGLEQAKADAEAADKAAKAAADAAAKAAQQPVVDPEADPAKKPPKEKPLAALEPMETLVGVPPSEQLAARKRVASSNRAVVNRISNVGTKLLANHFRAMEKRVLKTAQSPVGVAHFEAFARSRLLVLANGKHGPEEALSIMDVDWELENKKLLETMNKVYTLSGESATHAVSTQVGVSVSWDLANPHVRAVTDKLATRVKGINQTSKDLIGEAVTKAAEDGKSASELADDLKGMFGDWTDSRAATVARTESMTSYGMASAAGYRMTDVVDRIQCFDNPDHTAEYGAEDGLSCAARDQLIDDLDSAELHIESEHPNGSLAIAPVLIGAE